MQVGIGIKMDSIWKYGFIPTKLSYSVFQLALMAER